MDLLVELVFMLSLAQPKILDTFLPPKSKARKLYEAIAKGQITDDQQAASFIYKGSSKTKKYLMLKRHLISKLSDLVLMGEFPNGIEINALQEKIQLDQQLSIAEKMLAQNIYHNAEKIIQRVYQKANNLWLTHTKLQSLRLFRLIFSLKGFPDETQNYQNQYLACLELSNQENQIIANWEIMQSKIKFSLSPNAKFAIEARHFTHQIVQQSAFESPFVKLIYYRFQIMSFSEERNWYEWQKSLEAWTLLLENYPFMKYNQILLEWNLAWANFLHYQKNIMEAEKYLKNALDLADYRAFNKFEIQARYFDLCLKTENYPKALAILNEINTVYQYEFLDKLDKAAWLIREAYLYFLMGKTTKNEFPNFQKKKFLAEFTLKTQVLNKDKQGYHVLFMIIRFLLVGLEEDENMEHWGNNLRVYYQRHLKEAPIKTRFFFKCLADSAKTAFEPSVLDEQSKKLGHILHQESTYYDVCELVPYEILWEKLLKNVEKLS